MGGTAFRRGRVLDAPADAPFGVPRASASPGAEFSARRLGDPFGEAASFPPREGCRRWTAPATALARPRMLSAAILASFCAILASRWSSYGLTVFSLAGLAFSSALALALALASAFSLALALALSVRILATTSVRSRPSARLGRMSSSRTYSSTRARAFGFSFMRSSGGSSACSRRMMPWAMLCCDASRKPSTATMSATSDFVNAGSGASASSWAESFGAESSAARGVCTGVGVGVPSRGSREAATGVSTAAAAAKTWLSRRIVAGPRPNVSLSAAKAAHRRRRSSDTERQHESSEMSTMGTSTRRVGSSGAAILWSGGGDLGCQKRSEKPRTGR